MTSHEVDSRPIADPVAEARRIAAAADAAGVALRVTGGVGIALACPSAAQPPLARTYADIDLAGLRRDSRGAIELLTGLGYEPDRQFNTLHGSRRLYFWDRANGRQLDVFLDVFEMCHRIDLAPRITRRPSTLPLADLLLCKLQIVNTNAKDLTDTLALLVDHELTDGDEGIDVTYLCTLTAADWGLWRTTTMVARRAADYASTLPGFEQGARVERQAGALLEAFDAAPKSRAWRLRARVGERKQWYEQPEETD